jgi:hypothetical protein
MYPQAFEEDYTEPLRIRIEHRDRTPAGHFRPRACVELTRTLRTSGFLAAIPAEELKSLLFLLSFLTANGDCFATVPQLAQAMGVSPIKARARMRRLQQWPWQGRPLVVCTPNGNGHEIFRLAPQAFPVREEDADTDLPAPAPLPAASREAVIAHSRAQYTRPRHEVEQQILEQLEHKTGRRSGQPPLAHPPLQTAEGIKAKEQHPAENNQVLSPLPGDGAFPADALSANASSTNASPALAPPAHAPTPEQAALEQQLMQQGVTPEQAQALVSKFDPLRIRRQLMWLPYRHARNPAGLLITAIEDDYEAPPALRFRKSQPPAEHSTENMASATPQAETSQQGISDALAVDVPADKSAEFPSRENPDLARHITATSADTTDLPPLQIEGPVDFSMTSGHET